MNTKKMKNYQILIGYKAVFTVDVKADKEEEAKQKALELFTDKRDNMGKAINLQDDTYNIHGICNMDETWNML